MLLYKHLWKSSIYLWKKKDVRLVLATLSVCPCGFKLIGNHCSLELPSLSASASWTLRTRIILINIYIYMFFFWTFFCFSYTGAKLSRIRAGPVPTIRYNAVICPATTHHVYIYTTNALSVYTHTRHALYILITRSPTACVKLLRRVILQYWYKYRNWLLLYRRRRRSARTRARMSRCAFS